MLRSSCSSGATSRSGTPRPARLRGPRRVDLPAHALPPGGLRALAAGAGASLIPVTLFMFFLSRRFGAPGRPLRPAAVHGRRADRGGTGLLVRHAGRQRRLPHDVLPGAILFGLGLAMTVAPLTATVLAGRRAARRPGLGDQQRDRPRRGPGGDRLRRRGGCLRSPPRWTASSPGARSTRAPASSSPIPRTARCRRRRRPAWAGAPGGASGADQRIRGRLSGGHDPDGRLGGAGRRALGGRHRQPRAQGQLRGVRGRCACGRRRTPGGRRAAASRACEYPCPSGRGRGSASGVSAAVVSAGQRRRRGCPGPGPAAPHHGHCPALVSQDDHRAGHRTSLLGEPDALLRPRRSPDTRALTGSA